MKSTRILTKVFFHPLTKFSLSVSEIESKIKIHEVRFVEYADLVDVESTQMIAQIGQRIAQFLNGEEVDFLEYELDMSGMTEFQQRVTQVARTIPRGEIISYTELARLAGYDKAVRPVASVMRRNRFPIIVPCHRVIRASGDIGGFCGKKDGEFVDLKRRLIGLEKKDVQNVDPER